MRFGWSPKDASLRIRSIAKVSALVFIAVYIVLYQLAPLADPWNDLVINLLLVIAAGLTASAATLIWLRYEPSEIQRRIWRYIATGLWSWTAAELTYGYQYLTQEEVSIGLPDVFWVAAYVFFVHAILIQYRLLAQPSRKEMLGRGLIALVLVIGSYALVYHLVSGMVDAQSQLEAIVNTFYPIADLCLAVFAIWLIRHFRGGVFARPWLGMLAFSFTDLLYAWIDTAGVYDQANTIWTGVFDTTYVGAYLILGLGLLSQWAFLKYGLRPPATAK